MTDHKEQAVVSTKVRNLVLRAIPLEIFGTFSLCYIGGMACAMGDNDNLSLNGIALCHGGILALMVYIAADISGGHFNPAVSFAMFLLDKQDFIVTMMYCGAQLLGGMIAGALICFNLSTGYISKMLMQDHTVLGYPNTAIAYSRWQAFLAETIATMTLVMGIILACETWSQKTEKKGYFALCIGMILASAIYGIGPVTGGALNPARMLGPMLVSGTVQTFTLPYIGGT